MRIALISMHTSPAAVPGSGDAGGMNVVVASAARALARAGHNVTVFTRADETTPAGTSPLGHGARVTALIAGPAELGKGSFRLRCRSLPPHSRSRAASTQYTRTTG
nr:glycosyltransferase [Leucobacter luti]